MATTHSQAVHDGLKKLYAESLYTDFVVAVDDKEWKVHKAVLFMHSDVLYKMSTEDQFIESKARRAELKEVEEQHVDAMIHFMYHGDYQISDCEGWSREPLTMPQVQFHISMVAMGDMYNVPSLRSYAKIRAINGIDRSNVIEMARELYQTVETPDEVRNHIASQFSCDMTRMITSVQGIAFEALLDEMPQLGVDVLKLHAREQCKGSFPNGCGCGSPRLSAPSDSSSEYQSD